MSRFHRPDFEALRRCGANRESESTLFREAYMWPHMNVEDLCRGKVLPLLINAGGRNPPKDFLFMDIESTHVGKRNGILTPATLPPQWFVSFKGNSSDTYGRVHRTEDYTDWISGDSMSAADGLEVLEIQERVIKVLTSVCKIILKDKGQDLMSPNYPSAPAPVTMKVDDLEWRSIPALAALAPYTVPQTIDLVKIRELVEAKHSAASDNILSLREDLGYFAYNVKDWSEHNYCWIPDSRGNLHPCVCSVANWKKLWYSIAVRVIHWSYESAYW
jgi:hypothetical protein